MRTCATVPERGGGKKRRIRGRESEHGSGPAPVEEIGLGGGVAGVGEGRGLDKHNTSVVGPRTTIWPDVHFSVGPAQFVNTYWQELHAG